MQHVALCHLCHVDHISLDRKRALNLPKTLCSMSSSNPVLSSTAVWLCSFTVRLCPSGTRSSNQSLCLLMSPFLPFHSSYEEEFLANGLTSFGKPVRVGELYYWWDVIITIRVGQLIFLCKFISLFTRVSAKLEQNLFVKI